MRPRGGYVSTHPKAAGQVDGVRLRNSSEKVAWMLLTGQTVKRCWLGPRRIESVAGR